MTLALPPCRQCGGALQRVVSMPGHVVCGSGHLFTEQDVHPPEAARARAEAAPAGTEGTSRLRRVGEGEAGG